MKNKITIREYIREIISANRFAVLATESEGQPHASLIAITPTEDYLTLIFATYRNTRKYTNLIQNGKVAVLFENRSIKDSYDQEISVLTAFGRAEEVLSGNTEADMLAHMSRHPELSTFLLSTDCAIFRVHVEAYQVVHGIENVEWWNIEDLNAF